MYQRWADEMGKKKSMGSIFDKPKNKSDEIDQINDRSGAAVFFACTACLLGVAILALVITALVFGLRTYNKAKDIDDDVDCDICVRNSTNCSDGNSCTYDYMQFGACANPNKPNGEVCDSACLTSSTGTCSAGACTGTCVGNCANISDCVDISGTSTFPNATCSSAGCIYTFSDTLPTEFNSTCNTDSAALKGICKIGVSTTYADCLQVDLNCDTAGMFTCIFSFVCTAWST